MGIQSVKNPLSCLRNVFPVMVFFYALLKKISFGNGVLLNADTLWRGAWSKCEAS